MVISGTGRPDGGSSSSFHVGQRRSPSSQSVVERSRSHSNNAYETCCTPRAFSVGALMLLVLAVSFANIVAIGFVRGSSDASHALVNDKMSPRSAFEGESGNAGIDYKRIEKMIQITLEAETRNLVREVGENIGKQALQTITEGLKEMTTDVVERKMSKRVDKDAQDDVAGEAKRSECICPKSNSIESPTTPLFPQDRVAHFASAIARVPKDAFVKSIEKQLGIPFEPSSDGEKDILLVYDRASAMPNNSSAFYSPREKAKNDEKDQIIDTIPQFDSAKEATENCDQLNIILTQPANNRKVCVALVPEYESSYIQKLMRLKVQVESDGRKTALADPSVPFQYVSRLQRVGNHDQIYALPSAETTTAHRDLLQKYFGAVDVVLDELKGKLSRIAINNTVIVMVCNYGHSVMLSNWICAAKARQIDISSLIVFATDEETADLVTSFGLTAYYDQGRFANHPKDAAKEFADATFSVMVLAKIRSAQLVASLGYNFLFQDVDVVWYKQPMQYFFEDDNGDNTFDIYFQEDGARSVMYAPYDANSGVYFVRNNERTRHYLTSVLMSTDFTLNTQNDQVVFGVLLNEHAVLHGLRVKVMSRYSNEFPGGFNFHDVSNEGKTRMKKVLNETSNTYMFHMSWTSNSAEKELYLRQMGLWYVHDNCENKPLDELRGNQKTGRALAEKCCSVKPLYSCHYRDKPSLQPCPDKPFRDEPNVPWW